MVLLKCTFYKHERCTDQARVFEIGQKTTLNNAKNKCSKVEICTKNIYLTVTYQFIKQNLLSKTKKLCVIQIFKVKIKTTIQFKLYIEV